MKAIVITKYGPPDGLQLQEVDTFAQAGSSTHQNIRDDRDGRGRHTPQSISKRFRFLERAS